MGDFFVSEFPISQQSCSDKCIYWEVYEHTRTLTPTYLYSLHIFNPKKGETQANQKMVTSTCCSDSRRFSRTPAPYQAPYRHDRRLSSNGHGSRAGQSVMASDGDAESDSNHQPVPRKRISVAVCNIFFFFLLGRRNWKTADNFHHRSTLS